MIKNAGITNKNKQLLINAINPIFSMMGAVYGATLLDRLGRRFMMLAGLSGALFSYILLTAFTASSAAGAAIAPDKASARKVGGSWRGSPMDICNTGPPGSC